MALLFYQRMGVSNAVTTVVVSFLAWPWTLKPLWSPLLEMYRTKKFFVVAMQAAGGAGLVLLALALPLPGYFGWSIAVLAVVAFASSTHDIAADGVYIASLTPKQQAAYAGWCGAFYNVARVFSMGGLIWLAGTLQDRFAASGSAEPMVRAWMSIFAALGAILLLLALWHARVLPTGGAARTSESVREAAAVFRDVVVSFFRKPHILLLLLFLFLYRAGEGQVIKIGPLFLQADRAAGGLGLTLQQFGTIYGTFGSGAFILGSVLGGYFVSWLGLRRALLPLVLVLNLPMLAYWYLSVALPTGTAIITAALCVEMFGYGFGFVGAILLIMQEIAPGPYQTSHYAFAGALLNLGVILPGAVSGWVQQQLGYQGFFVWAVVSAIPAVVLARFLPIRGAQEPRTT
ncbi:MAG: AmpG family muropeptide MFS transporter [Gemmatimonadetes bacterium]|nr:AmpG family muropeptide MFS transporter [Gemmatimonadota bacterium]